MRAVQTTKQKTDLKMRHRIPRSLADTEAHAVHLNSKATRGAGYISVNETFTDQKGNQYNFFMNGLKEENTADKGFDS